MLVRGAVMENVLTQETLFSVNSLFHQTTNATLVLTVREYSHTLIAINKDSAQTSKENQRLLLALTELGIKF